MIFGRVHVETKNVVSVSGVESLCVIGRIVDHSHCSNMIDNLASLSVIQVIPTIVTTVTVT